MNTIKSPITGNHNVLKIKEYSTNEIIEFYQKAFDIDTSNYFKKLDSIYLYKCLETNYLFYYPFNVYGDSEFYEKLEQFDWYYMPWKWEHEKAKSIIKQNSNVLEIGCAEGHFLERIKNDLNCNIQGLEFNNDAIKKAVKKGLNVSSESIEEFSKTNIESFDFVCSFQVLEHVSNIHSFINSMINCLKPGGKLIIGVPNNESFLGFIESKLNMPPHHMGLWDRTSLKSLSKLHNISEPNFYFEPPQPQHKDDLDKTYFNLRINKLDDNIKKYGLFGKVLNLYYKKFFKSNLIKENPSFENFTILAEYIKVL